MEGILHLASQLSPASQTPFNKAKNLLLSLPPTPSTLGREVGFSQRLSFGLFLACPPWLLPSLFVSLSVSPLCVVFLCPFQWEGAKTVVLGFSIWGSREALYPRASASGCQHAPWLVLVWAGKERRDQSRPDHHLLGADELTRCMIPTLHEASRGTAASASQKRQGLCLWNVATQSRWMAVHWSPDSKEWLALD